MDGSSTVVCRDARGLILKRERGKIRHSSRLSQLKWGKALEVERMPAEPEEDFAVEESMPEASVPLESILCTE